MEIVRIVPVKKYTFFKLTLFAFGVFLLCVGCKTLPAKPKAVLIEHPERFFWEIKTDTASVFVLGTIHIADKTFYPLEENVLKAFDSADMLVSEIGGQRELMLAVVGIQKRIAENIEVDPKKSVSNFLSEDDTEFLKGRFGEANIERLFLFKPWVLTSAVNKATIEDTKLDLQEGIDFYLMARAGGKKIEALESIDTQLDILFNNKTIGFEEQMEILKAAIQELKNPKKTAAQYTELKRLYVHNDKKGLMQFIRELMKVPGMLSEANQKKYLDSLLKDRNIKWAEKLDAYLKTDGTVFVFAGAAHFLGEDSVFEIMKKKRMITESADTGITR